MTEHEVREKIAGAVDACFSDLRDDPHLAQRIRRAAEGEEKVKRKLSFGLILAIVLILTTIAAAIAAARLGWVDYFGGVQGITVPKAAQEALDATAPLEFQVGPMTFTFSQLLTDKRIAMSSAEIRLTDGSEGLCADNMGVYDAVDALSDVVRERYKLPSGISWMDAAKQLDLPLYSVRALVEPGPEHDGGTAMEDVLWQEDGSVVYFSLPLLAPGSVGETLPITLYMHVAQLDPTTGEPMDEWRVRESITLSAVPLLAEKTYLPQGDALLGQLTPVKVYAEQYATGIYLTSVFKLPEGMGADALYDLMLCDAEDNELPGGLNMSGHVSADNLPMAELQTMTSLERLPESILLTDGTVKILMK